MSQATRNALILMSAGFFAGFLSGMFGIGGGTVIVPALMAVGFSQRQASASSLLAIVPTCLSGVISYSWSGRIAWVPALLMMIGMLLGVQGGTWLLARMREVTLRWCFVAFILTLIALQVLYVPAREGVLTLNPAVACALVAIGGLCGFLAGLLGIGGGAVAVPGLTLLGMSDLGARGLYGRHAPGCAERYLHELSPRPPAPGASADGGHRCGMRSSSGSMVRLGVVSTGGRSAFCSMVRSAFSALNYCGAKSAPNRIRTCDLSLRRRTLYPLSYRGNHVSLSVFSPSSNASL